MSMCPFLFPFLSVDRWLSFGKHCLKWTEDDCRVAQTLLSCNRIPLITGFELAFYLGISEELVHAIFERPGKYYRTFALQKKSGGERQITAPRVFLKVIQRYILDCILSSSQPHDAAFGFVRGRSPAQGAERHVGHSFLWNIDLKDFFPSIKQAQVERLFLSFGYLPSASHVLSSLCCLNGFLPQGAPTSPSIANQIFLEADIEIAKLCGDYGISYSRYADDLSFSAKEPIPVEFMNSIKKLVVKFGFSINAKKTRLMGPKCRREVTGLTVNDKVSIPRIKRRQIRSQFHRRIDSKLSSVEMQKLCGIAAWVSVYHPNEGGRYLQQLQKSSDPAE